MSIEPRSTVTSSQPDNPCGPPQAVSPGASETPLLRDRSFIGITATQFLGAFNDNLFKQLMLLLAIPASSVAASSGDRQAVATIVFAFPFILCSGYAGFLSDRYSKTRVIVLSKVAEIVVMSLGLFAFLAFASSGYSGLLLVLFLMGLQSTVLRARQVRHLARDVARRAVTPSERLHLDDNLSRHHPRHCRRWRTEEVLHGRVRTDRLASRRSVERLRDLCRDCRCRHGNFTVDPTSTTLATGSDSQAQLARYP